MKFFRVVILIGVVVFGSRYPVHSSSPKMLESPHFWLKKLINPNQVLLTPTEIRKMNEETLKHQDLLLCDVKKMKEEWDQEEILAFLKEDWISFGQSEKVRYGRRGIPLNDSFWNAVRENIHLEGLREKNRLLFALTTRRTDIRVFPTDEASLNVPSQNDFDLFQHSAIAPASPVGIYHFSRDRLWAYGQAPFIRGWIRTADLAIAKNKNDVLGQGEIKEPLVITGNFNRIFADPLFQQPVFSAQMGSTFHILHLPPPSPLAGEGQGEGALLNERKTDGKFSLSKENQSAIGNYYVIKIPFREADGRLTFRNGYISANDDVHYGFLPYTQKNLARQAFKMLHQPYGWGEKGGGRDCSRFIMDLFNTFGMLMPRNSNLQAKMGISLGDLGGKTIEDKKKILDRAVPLATLLRLPGHIMLYLGKHEEKHYAIHSLWGFQKKGPSGVQTHKIGKVVVTNLDLGKDGPNGSLLHRLTQIQFIGAVDRTVK